MENEKGVALNPLDGTTELARDSADAATKIANAQAEIYPQDSSTTKAEKVERQGASLNGHVEQRASPPGIIKQEENQDVVLHGEPSSKTLTHGIAEPAQSFKIEAPTSPTVKTETIRREEASPPNEHEDGRPSPPKRIKREEDHVDSAARPPTTGNGYKKGVASIKSEYLIPHIPGQREQRVEFDDDAAEAGDKGDDGRDDGRGKGRGDGRRGKRQKERGQNKARKFGSSKDEIRLCTSRATSDEFSPKPCSYGDGCRNEHDLRRYLDKGRRGDLDTFGGGKCPPFEARGWCPAGWKCRFHGAHSEERTRPDGRKELVLLGTRPAATTRSEDDGGGGEGEGEGEAVSTPGVANVVPMSAKILMRKKKFPTPKSDAYNAWLESRQRKIDEAWSAAAAGGGDADEGGGGGGGGGKNKADVRAGYVEAPLRASEKRRIYYGPETPVLAPLTTQGNLPFRRLCVGLGAQVTWSEMAMGLPLIQGEKGEWALLKAHESELSPPNRGPPGDVKFGAQVAASKAWLATKTVETVTALCPALRAVDLNCGCPIDLVYRQGAGSALLDNPGRMEKMLRGMNAVSGAVPITCKIRMGTRDGAPTADRLVQRLVLGGGEAAELGEGPAGVAAITLHGRSRQQRYTRSADWAYIAETGALIERLQRRRDDLADTVREADPRDLSNGGGKVYFVGNGDCYSHVDYHAYLRGGSEEDNNGPDAAKAVDSVMIARGALMKPWIFEEIERGQYLDKTARERLEYVERFARYGLEYWGSDEIGVGTTRRFLLEWLSFSCRYVPVGLLEHLPPRLGDRPPPFKGRDELETLMCSQNYKDWIKISELFLGPAHKDFQFQPKHKSNSYEIEAEG